MLPFVLAASAVASGHNCDIEGQWVIRFGRTPSRTGTFVATDFPAGTPGVDFNVSGAGRKTCVEDGASEAEMHLWSLRPLAGAVFSPCAPPPAARSLTQP